MNTIKIIFLSFTIFAISTPVFASESATLDETLIIEDDALAINWGLVKNVALAAYVVSAPALAAATDLANLGNCSLFDRPDMAGTCPLVSAELSLRDLMRLLLSKTAFIEAKQLGFTNPATRAILRDIAAIAAKLQQFNPMHILGVNQMARVVQDAMESFTDRQVVRIAVGIGVAAFATFHGVRWLKARLDAHFERNRLEAERALLEMLRQEAEAQQDAREQARQQELIARRDVRQLENAGGDCGICMDSIGHTNTAMLPNCIHGADYCAPCLAVALERNNTCPQCRAPGHLRN
jgi:hypothetical protein